MTRRRSRQSLLQSGLDKRATTEADINHRIYVRPLGDAGLHIVKRRPDGAEDQVAGPARTFVPGQFVPTGRHTNTQGETILIEPPPGKRGQAAPPTTQTSPPLPVATMTGGVVAVGGTYPGYETEIDAEGTGFTPVSFFELTGETKRDGTPTPGFIVLLEYSYQSSERVILTITTADSYIADGDEDDPHPGFYVNIYSDIPPNGRLAGVSEWYYLVGT